MFPAFVVLEAEVDLDEGTPFGPAGLADEVHADFLRGVIGLEGIAGDTGADDIFPGGGAAAVAGDDVVEVEVLSVEDGAAVLAGIFVAFEDVVPGELDFLFGKAVKDGEQDDAWDAEAEGDGGDGFRVRLLV